MLPTQLPVKFGSGAPQFGPNQWRVPHDGSEWDAELEAADILIMEEHFAPKMIPEYPGKKIVVLQGNAAAALMTCHDEGCAAGLRNMAGDGVCVCTFGHGHHLCPPPCGAAVAETTAVEGCTLAGKCSPRP